MENRLGKTLIILEILFCDNEQDNDIIKIYFERFKLCLESINQSNYYSNNFDCHLILYISDDKTEYIDKLSKIVLEFRIPCTVIHYKHRYNLYTKSTQDHIDRIKNPNRSPILRDDLFKYAGLDEKINLYDTIIRTALDDDDAIPRWHFDNVFYTANSYYNNNTEENTMIAFTNLNIVYLYDDNIIVENVEVNKAINGNKFYVVKDKSRLYELSPWSIPDIIDEDVQNTFLLNQGIRLLFVKNIMPGAYYLRWGKNLSNNNKSALIEKVNYSREIKNIETLILGSEIFFCPKTSLKISSFITNDTIFFSTNADKLGLKNYHLAFYIYLNNQVIYKLGYSRNINGSQKISISEGVYKVKAFLKQDNVVIATAITNKVYIRG